MRRKLIHTFVEYTIQNVIWIKQNQFLDVFNKIKELFNFEYIENYYNEKTKGDGEAFPGGQLFSHFKYRHDLLKKETGIRVNRKMKVTALKEEITSTLTSLEAETIRRDLIGRQEPWERILKDWERTAPNRRNEMLALLVAGTVPRWPKYKKKQGIQLVSIIHLSLILYLRNLFSWSAECHVVVCSVYSSVVIRHHRRLFSILGKLRFPLVFSTGLQRKVLLNLTCSLS